MIKLKIMEAPLSYFMKKVLADKGAKKDFYEQILNESSLGFQKTADKWEGVERKRNITEKGKKKAGVKKK